MNKKIVFGLLSIFVVAIMVGAGAFAAFTSTASNNGNTFGSGTMTLKIENAEGTTSTPYFTVDNSSNLKPGDTRTQTIKLSNSGSLKIGSVKLTGLVVAPLTTPDPLNKSLGDVLTLKLYRDSVSDSSPNNLIGTARKLTGSWTDQDLGITIEPKAGSVEGSRNIVAVLTFDADANSDYQSKSVTFGFTFQGTQEIVTP